MLLTTISSDSHTWNLVFMQLYLEELGHEVINLGSCVPTDLLLKKAHHYRPDMITVSSINGHANIEGVYLAQAVRACHVIKDTCLVIGGKLGTKGDDNNQYIDKLQKAGFDGVFGGNESIRDFMNYLKELNTFFENKIGLAA
ncbi:MAG: hypothetical protein COB66_04900 [Coxiella sp. (in: Bacteria)]|nr:MAG: hypothetical protein COB66_04900 [Coxiella sp. (in: g-proteobacteria)]